MEAFYLSFRFFVIALLVIIVGFTLLVIPIVFLGRWGCVIGVLLFLWWPFFAAFKLAEYDL